MDSFVESQNEGHKVSVVACYVEFVLSSGHSAIILIASNPCTKRGGALLPARFQCSLPQTTTTASLTQMSCNLRS